MKFPKLSKKQLVLLAALTLPTAVIGAWAVGWTGLATLTISSQSPVMFADTFDVETVVSQSDPLTHTDTITMTNADDDTLLDFALTTTKTDVVDDCTDYENDVTVECELVTDYNCAAVWDGISTASCVDVWPGCSYSVGVCSGTTTATEPIVGCMGQITSLAGKSQDLNVNTEIAAYTCPQTVEHSAVITSV